MKKKNTHTHPKKNKWTTAWQTLIYIHFCASINACYFLHTFCNSAIYGATLSCASRVLRAQSAGLGAAFIAHTWVRAVLFLISHKIKALSW